MERKLLLGQSYFNALSQSNVIHAPSFVGAAKKSKVSFCYNRIYDDDPTVSPGMTNLYLAFDKLLKNQTVGIGGYISFDRVKTTKPFENFFLTSEPPEFKSTNVSASFILTSKYSLPNLRRWQPKYSFSPALFLRFNQSKISDIDTYLFDVEKIKLDYTQTISVFSTLSIGGGCMITSKNAFLSVKISGESGFYKNEFRSVSAGFGQGYDSSDIKRTTLISSEQCVSGGILFPKREEASFRFIISGAIGRLGTTNDKNFTRNTHTYQNDHPFLPIKGVDYHAANILLRYHKVMVGVGQTKYFGYSILSYLIGFHFDRIRIMNGISNQGYSLGATVLFD